MKRATIVGAHGQDGRLLTGRLREAGYEVAAIGRDDWNVTNRLEAERIIGRERPDELYYLAAHHNSSEDNLGDDTAALFEASFDVQVTGLVNLLEATRKTSPATKLFYAASSHVFSPATGGFQDENTPLNPQCVYGITKTAGIHCCRFYRRVHGVHASVGIMYNHESPFRAEKFVSQKIVRGALRIAEGRQESLLLGDLSAAIDWGYAPDYVDAMTRIVALPEADDFVIATGEAHTVQEFVELAFTLVGLEWNKYVREDPSLIARRKKNLTGNSSRLRAATGWRPSVTFPEMVEILLNAQRNAA